jgi:hypothetical protein
MRCNYYFLRLSQFLFFLVQVVNDEPLLPLPNIIEEYSMLSFYDLPHAAQLSTSLVTVNAGFFHNSVLWLATASFLLWGSDRSSCGIVIHTAIKAV